MLFYTQKWHITTNPVTLFQSTSTEIFKSTKPFDKMTKNILSQHTTNANVLIFKYASNQFIPMQVKVLRLLDYPPNVQEQITWTYIFTQELAEDTYADTCNSCFIYIMKTFIRQRTPVYYPLESLHLKRKLYTNKIIHNNTIHMSLSIWMHGKYYNPVLAKLNLFLL